MASLVDTNILVYRFDPRDPVKQRVADDLLRAGLSDDTLVLPHQAILELVAAVTRPRQDLGGEPLLPLDQALVEAEELMAQFRVVYPTSEVLHTAFRGAATYRLSWFDAHLWAHAEVHGIPEILSEDFEHGRHYGSVRTVDPFLAAESELHELPPLFADDAPAEGSVALVPPARHEGSLPRPELSASGVDLSLIRWMLSLAPAERLEALQGFVDSVWELRRDNAS